MVRGIGVQSLEWDRLSHDHLAPAAEEPCAGLWIDQQGGLQDGSKILFLGGSWRSLQPTSTGCRLLPRSADAKREAVDIDEADACEATFDIDEAISRLNEAKRARRMGFKSKSPTLHWSNHM